MKPNFYAVLIMSIEEGVAHGINRAYKHTDHPTRDTIAHEVQTAVMTSLHEWFDFEEAKE